MEIVQLKAEKREELGKGPAGRLRRQAAVPGVAYGMAREPIHLSVSAAELDRLFYASEGGNVLIDLKVPGAPRKKNTVSIIKEIQRDPVTGEALSVDFQWISLEEKITVEVPVEVTGTAPGVVDDGGVVQMQMHNVQVSCLPTEIPDQVVANIDGMHIADTLQVADIEVTSGVEVLADPEEVLLSIAAPIREEELEVRVDEGLLEQLVDLEPGEELAVEEAEELVPEEAEEVEEGEEAEAASEETAEQPE